MIKAFDEWFGGSRSEGYATSKEAERELFNVLDGLYHTRGIVEIQVSVVDRFGNDRYWVHNTSTYDPDAPRRKVVW